MSYYRAMRVDEIAAWLLKNGVAEDEAETLAAALVDTFDVMGYSKTAE